MSIFKACDIRGEFGTELRVEHATALGHALAADPPPGRVLVAGDGRLSTPQLKDALIVALTECGVPVVDLGFVPTPVFYFARRQLGIPVGVMVTASHNPAPDNGFKIILGELPISPPELAALRALMENDEAPPRRTPAAVTTYDVIAEYLAAAGALATERGRLKVVVDSGNGMWGPLAPGLLSELGYDVVELFSEVDGRFPNRPSNPSVASNLTALCAAVPENGAALGIAFDGDGDRVVFVDEHGAPVENDRAIVLFARDALAKHPGAAVVYDQKCSDIVREEIAAHGGKPRIEKSGHTFIKTTFLETEAAYAGELSGHHFFRAIGGDDGLVAALRMASIVQNAGQSLSQLVAAMPTYAITPDVRLHVAPGETELIIEGVRKNLKGALEISDLDGVRAQFSDGWGLVRASVTEPAVTLRFEGHTPEALERVKAAFVEAAPQLAGRLP